MQYSGVEGDFLLIFVFDRQDKGDVMEMRTSNNALEGLKNLFFNNIK